ncbi:hypothetical protein CDD82_3178 [Ophiocordyceps australis]|uniref:RING-type domain-containing protein n=1 Tax=Ophiocordyceps australis TaxID=1399860 RepID=A0A2C5ZED4_9HYPO|nr:hypothetical protein CDD82_3178 [Ophiocordyceps australis]
MSTPSKSPTPRSRDRFAATPSPIVRSQWWSDLRLPQSSSPSPSPQRSRFRFAAFAPEASLGSALAAFDHSPLPQSLSGEQQPYSAAALPSSTSGSSFSSEWSSDSTDGESSLFVSSLHLSRNQNNNTDVDEAYPQDDEDDDDDDDPLLAFFANTDFSSPSTFPSFANLVAHDTSLSPQSSLHSSQSTTDQSTLAGSESDSSEDSAVQFVHTHGPFRSLNPLSRESSLFVTDSDTIPSSQESTQTTVFDMPPRQMQNILNSPEPPSPDSNTNKRRRLDSNTGNPQNSTAPALVLPQRPSFTNDLFSEDALGHDTQATPTIDLTVSAEAIEQQFSKPEPDKRIKLASFQCVICMDDVTALTVTHCGHLFCQQCLHSSLHVEANRGNCPMCRTKIDTKPRVSYTSKTKGYWPLELKLMTVTKKGKRKANVIN